MAGYEAFIAGRYLRARRKQVFVAFITFMSVIGVMVGVAALIIVFAVMRGFETDLKDKILGANAHITLMSFDGAFGPPEDHLAAARAVEGVAAVAPFVDGQAMMLSETIPAGVYVRGSDPAMMKSVTTLTRQFKEGSFDALLDDDPDGLPGLVVGWELANQLGLFVGDSVTLVSPWGKVGPFGFTPGFSEFRVVGIFSFGLYEVDSAVVYTTLAAAQQFFSVGDRVTAIEITVDDLDHVEAIASRLDTAFGKPFWTRDWLEANSNFVAALKLERIAFAVIFGLTVLIAGFNIVTTLILMVIEKHRDIAILKTMGATSAGISRIFIYTGVVVGVIGTLLGVCVGVGICYAQIEWHIVKLDPSVYTIPYLPVKVEAWSVAAIAVFAFIVSLLTTLYPSRQAARLDPAQALRYN